MGLRQFVLSGTGAPTTGTWRTGDFIRCSLSNGPLGWRCLAGGSPGTWKPEGGQLAKGNIIAAVAAAGNDAATAARPDAITNGDVSGVPYQTGNGLVAVLPTYIPVGFTATLDFAAETFAQTKFKEIHGGGTLKLQGAAVLSTLATGSNSGTCGTGTSTTSFKKPTAAADWTADDLDGLLVQVTVGSTVYWRKITTNTTDTATLNTAVPGLDNTATFQILTVSTIFTAGGNGEGLTFEDCSVNIVVELAGVSTTTAMVFRRCPNVTANGLLLNTQVVDNQLVSGILSNIGGSAQTTYALPPATADFAFDVVNGISAGTVLQAAPGDVIDFLNAETSSGGAMTTTDVYAGVRIVGQAGRWVATTTPMGTWIPS